MSTWNNVLSLIGNPISEATLTGKKVAAIFGEKPSVSAKSPSLWNPCFEDLGLPAVFLPFDVEAAKLPTLLNELRKQENFLGGSVAVPYKVAIMECLDAIDPMTAKIGAVNTIVRSSDGKLTGFNTDGKGALDALVKTMPGQKEPFFASLRGKKVVLIGAGGAARSVAFFIAEAVGATGEVQIVNRSLSGAQELAGAIGKSFPVVKASDWKNLVEIAKSSDLVVNCTSVGQVGLQKVKGSSQFLFLESTTSWFPSALQAVEDQGSLEATTLEFLNKNQKEILDHQSKTLAIMGEIPKSVAFYDIVHTPSETLFLRMGRWAGHRTLNGKGMSVGQAVDGFFKVCGSWLEEKSLMNDATYGRVFSTMFRVW